MRKITASLLAAIAACVVPASADHGAGEWEAAGTVLVANPTTRQYAGVTELVSACNGSIDPDVPPGAAQGVDGYWFQLPAGSTGHAARLTSTTTPLPAPAGLSVAAVDFDAWFYDSGCGLIKPSQDPNAYHMATAGSNEFGVVPENAEWVAVNLIQGANASFSFRILDWPAEPAPEG